MARFYPYSDLPRLKHSPQRDRLDANANRQRAHIHWLAYEIGDYVRVQVHIYNRDYGLIRRHGLTCLCTSYDPAEVAERIAEWIMDPWPATAPN